MKRRAVNICAIVLLHIDAVEPFDLIDILHVVCEIFEALEGA